ncbi:GNAT family acetyltransferase, putative [Coccidioides posadasii C735 delta SOWgp]|uniref:GNAT family acetyltransferase, putative n=1 Tax=Coccidioides posadasii (strain C735) TaxID=222929 RepID=C5P9Q4_COCP7|nr:GNAT family acetyltransferase, putative [Coccidioides posadasii C735 delta SOWgp]EER26466.1 GNAT family acetyltransferase, putative [Coccidioides posadasii C735 delta SOWgp]|eukprot:XP_003068611.1 GNAT family acetyltransferase, putative [Coccidioides posadasii C735 delta SOWgp]
MAAAPAPLSIRYAAESDLPSLGHLEIVAFPTSKYLSNTFPNADPQVLQNFKSVLLGGSLPDPEVHALVAVDPSTDQTVAYCRWTIPTAYGYGDAPRAEISCQAAARAAKALEYAPESTNKEIYDMFASLLKAKQKVHTREDDMILNMLCVLPEYQGRGIGKQFLKWGMEKADAKGARIYLESTPAGYPMYQKYGWEAVEECVINYVPFGGEGTQTFVFMMRNPRTPNPAP